jgi:hypothetical protein
MKGGGGLSLNAQTNQVDGWLGAFFEATHFQLDLSFII